MPTDCAKRKIIYVMGLGRSGTTLMDIVLGNGDRIHSCGEINRYPLRKGVRRHTPEDSNRQAFWQLVGERLADSDPRFLQFDRMQGIHQRYEYHFGYLRDLLLGVPESADLELYYAYLNALYDALFELSQSDVLVDSSKYSGRAWHLARALPSERYEIAYVYLRRHPISTVRSFQKRGIEQSSKHWLGANIIYRVVNQLCARTCNALEPDHRVLRISFEEFLQQPQASLSKLEQALNIDLRAARERLRNRQALSVGNLFDGNRIRHQTQIELNPATEVKAETLLDRLSWLVNKKAYQL